MRECLKKDDISIDSFIRVGGMTNKNYKVKTVDESFILRLPGEGTEKIIDRKSEVLNVKAISVKDIDVKIIYINEENGIKITKYIEDAETLNKYTAKEDKNLKLVSELLLKLHNSKIEMRNEFNPFYEIKKYEDIIIKNRYEFYKGYDSIRNKVLNLKKDLDTSLVPSHNDTLPDNFIKDKDGKLYLIDWEYSGMNNRLWDLAAYSLEAELLNFEEDRFLKYYLNREIEEKDRLNLLINKILQDILWSLWTIIKENEGVDYGHYGIDRYNRGIRNLEKYTKGLIYE